MPFSDFTGNNNGNNNSGGNNNSNIFGIPPLNMGGAASNGADDATDLLINYNEKFKNDGGVLFRENVINQTLATLIALTKPNPLLIGSAGVGKTKIAEAIAYELANNTSVIPKELIGYTIYELPLSNIVAGSSFVGQIEEKIKSVIDFISDSKNKAILFIDEIHQLAGEKQTYRQIGQILKPALARNDMRVIGSTTLQEANEFMDDPALNRRFSRIIVDELTKSQTVEILKNMKAKFFTHYGNRVLINDAVIENCVEMSTFYAKAGSHRPDSAITLLDRTIGEAILRRQTMEQQAQNDPVLLQAIQANPMINISEKQLKITALRLMTGNAQKNELDIDELKKALSEIKGQENALRSVVYNIHERESIPCDTENEKPLVFMFAGTSGVGKTEVAKILAKTLTGQDPIKLSMAEYHSPASINRIIGSPAGYIGSDSNAELPFDALESNPYRVIILDEFEKCDISVQRLFMEAFDEGTMKTAKGKEVLFNKAIFICTTNAGFKIRTNSVGFTQTSAHPSMQDIIQTLSNYFDPELLNRIQSNGDIITFNEISKKAFAEILKNAYEKEAIRLKKTKKRITIPDTLDDATLSELTDTNYIPEFGARPIRGIVRKYIANLVL